MQSLWRVPMQDDRAQLEIAQKMAARVCVADLLELQRLTSQLQQLQQWASS